MKKLLLATALCGVAYFPASAAPTSAHCRGHDTFAGWKLDINSLSPSELAEIKNIADSFGLASDRTPDIAAQIDKWECGGVPHDNAVKIVISAIKAEQAIEASNKAAIAARDKAAADREANMTIVHNPNCHGYEIIDGRDSDRTILFSPSTNPRPMDEVIRLRQLAATSGVDADAFLTALNKNECMGKPHDRAVKEAIQDARAAYYSFP